MQTENKIIGGLITDFKQIERNGVPVGIIEGYIATWDVDRGADKFLKGAFADSIERHRRDRRPIRMKNQHKNVIGGWPIDSIKEDDRGLFGVGEINLETQEGKETFSLIKQGILSDLSIGYSVKDSEMENNVRVIRESEVWEGSIVDEPMNPKANITAVKKVNSRSALPKSFADRGLRWDSSAAQKRVREWAGAEDGPNNKYKSAFMWYDSDDEENFGAYKLQVADIVDGGIKIIPRAVFAVRAVLSGARGGVDIPEADQTKIKGIINTLYDEMGLEKPFGEKIRPFCLTEIKNMSKGTLDGVIRYCTLSKDASSFLVDICIPAIAGKENPSEKNIDELLNTMRAVKNNIRS